MMSDTIVVAFISGGMALVGTVISNLFTHSKTIYRIEQLEKKQDKHNNLIERMYACESAINLLDEKEKNCEDDIDDIRRRLDHAV